MKATKEGTKGWHQRDGKLRNAVKRPTAVKRPFPFEHGSSLNHLMRPNLLLLLLLAVICGTHALSLSEETALEALFQNFSALASANPPWHANASSACEAPIFYGLTCSDGDDQHVLRLYASRFGWPLGSSFTSPLTAQGSSRIPV